MTGAVVSSGQIERDFGVCGDALPAKRNRTAPQFFQAQVSARVNFDVLTTFDEQDVQEEDMEDEGMEEVGEMGDSDGLDSSEEAVHDLTST